MGKEKEGREKEEEGVLDVSFPVGFHLGQGKAGTVENAVSLDVAILQGFFCYLFIFKTAEKSFLGRSRSCWMKCGSVVGGGNHLWCLVFGRYRRRS